MSSNAGPRLQVDPGTAAAALPGAAARPVVGIVTGDATLLATLRQAAGDEVSIAVVDRPEDLAQLLVDRGCCALFVCLDALGDAAATLLPHLAHQFSDVPLVAVGTRADETVVARMITAGEVYRFLHRPVSHERARTFLTAALRRADEARRSRPQVEEPAPEPAPVRTPPPASPPPRARDPFLETQRFGRPPSNVPAFVFAGTTLAIALAAGVTFWMRPAPPPPSAADPLIADLVGAANVAAAAGSLLTPPGRSAADLYREALDRRPGDTEARAALLALADRMLGEGERALVTGSLEAAETAADTVALVRPRDPRVAALRLQVERARATRAIASLPAAPEPALVPPRPPGGTANTDERAAHEDARQTPTAAPAEDPAPPGDSDAVRDSTPATTTGAPSLAAVPPDVPVRAAIDAAGAGPSVTAATSTGPAEAIATTSPPAAPLPPAPAALATAPAPAAVTEASPRDATSAVPRPVLRKIADAAPAYPAQAKSRNVEGWVDVAFTVDPDGRTTNVRVISAQPAATFDAAALDAVRRWRYAPLPVAQDANVRLRFRLER